MKSIKFFAFAIAAFLTVSTVVYLNSCTTDKCKNVTCNNGGTCTDGTCNCTTGYEDATCSTEMRTKFLVSGSFTESGHTDSSWNSSSHTSTTTYAIAITKGSNVNSILIGNLGNYNFTTGSYNVPATMTSSTTFTFTNQIIAGTTFNGSGSIAAGKVSISYVAVYPDNTSGHTNKTVTDTYTAVQN